MKKIDGRTKAGKALKAAEARRVKTSDGSPVKIVIEQPKTILQEAGELIYGDREAQYGPPSKNLGDIANLWEMYLHGKYGADHPIDKEDVCQMMVLLKMARGFNGPKKRDTIVDQAGYTGLLERVVK